jgi:hypothetical protein
MLLLVREVVLNDISIYIQDMAAPPSQEGWSQMIATLRHQVAIITPTTPHSWLSNHTQGLWARQTTHRLSKNLTKNLLNSKMTEVPHSSTRQALSRLRPPSSLPYLARSSIRMWQTNAILFISS